MRRSLLCLFAFVSLASACSSDDESADPTTTAVTSDSSSTTVATSIAPPETTTTTSPTREPVADPVAEVSGPVTGGIYGVPYNPAPRDVLSEHGYLEEEFFVIGEAVSYLPEGELTADGLWTVAEAGSAPYNTRVLVRRPEDPSQFNGVVLVEWLNVTAGRDSDPDFGFLHPLLLAEGYVYVGVSAQQIGVEGGTAPLEVPGVDPVALLALKPWDAERYGTLSHPGDQYSYDIFSQVGTLVREPGEIDILGGLTPDNVIAAGESQSAGRMTTYVNAVQPIAGVFDGFFIHSRSRSGSALAPDVAAPPGLHIRSDLDVPVFQFETETDVPRGFVEARQPDTDLVVTWEVAGTAHADQSTLDYGALSGEVWFDGESPDWTAICGQVNQAAQDAVLRAAFAALTAWVVDGTPPPTADPIEVVDGTVVRDELGNALGGVRTPAVDAPIAVHTGVTQAESVFCSLFGQTIPFTDEQVAALYPTPAHYAAAVTAAADAAVERGHLLQADADAMIAAAEAR